MVDQKGFTLLELLISMTLVAIVVVILSMALRSGINAYTRSKEYNRFYLPQTSLYGLLWRQLEAVVSPSDPKLSSYSRLRGRTDALSFITTYVPQGTSVGGIFQVVYLFDKDNNRLIYGQKIITSRTDITRKIPDFLADLDNKELLEQGWLTDEMKDVQAFSIVYRPSNADPNSEPKDWDDSFKRGSHQPLEIAFQIRFKAQKDEDAQWQVIPVGIK